jgi:hypothetical protein
MGALGRALKALAFPAVLFGLVPWLVLEHGRFPPLVSFPYAVLFLVWGGALVVRGVRRRRRDGKGAVQFNVGILLLALAAAETWAGLTAPVPLARGVVSPPDGAYSARHDDLGYAPVPGRANRFVMAAGTETLFDVTYTIEADGLRARPPEPTPPAEGTVLLFGCSFAYGHGLPDEATIGWRLEERLGGRLRVLPFAFSGWGPHQMLANLESGRVAALAKAPVRAALYLALSDHPVRVAGEMLHDRHGPRYVANPDGTVTRAGAFGDDRGRLFRMRMKRHLSRTYLGRLLAERLAPPRPDVPLFAAVVDQARRRVAEAWPDASFTVLLWDDPPGATDAMEAALKERGLRVLRVGDLLPDLRTAPGSLKIHDPAEGHPNAAAADGIAAALAEDLAR